MAMAGRDARAWTGTGTGIFNCRARTHCPPHTARAARPTRGALCSTCAQGSFLYVGMWGFGILGLKNLFWIFRYLGIVFVTILKSCLLFIVCCFVSFIYLIFLKYGR
jgi:hypothetical protein